MRTDCGFLQDLNETRVCIILFPAMWTHCLKYWIELCIGVLLLLCHLQWSKNLNYYNLIEEITIELVARGDESFHFTHIFFLKSHLILGFNVSCMRYFENFSYFIRLIWWQVLFQISCNSTTKKPRCQDDSVTSSMTKRIECTLSFVFL